MSGSEENGVALFESIHHVLAAERILRECGIWLDLVPVPRSLTSDCGIAIEFRMRDLEKIQSALGGDDPVEATYYRPLQDGYDPIEV